MSEYEGYLFLKSDGPTPSVVVSLIDWSTGISLASAVVNPNTPLQNWTKFDFKLTPSASSRCYNDTSPAKGTKCHKNAESLCITCTAAFTITIANSTTASSAVKVDMVYLGAGGWNQFQGQQTRRDAVDGMFGNSSTQPTDKSTDKPTDHAPGPLVGPEYKMGWGVSRLGGSDCNSAEYRWKRFQGPVWNREPFDGTWYKKYSSPGWRVFEFLQMCEGAQVPAVVTLNNEETPADMADLVEYAYGDKDSTTWGKRRASDGHPAAYDPFTVEIGNEQGLTSELLNDVIANSRAMHDRAMELKMKHKLSFVVGGNGWTPAKAAPFIEKLQNLSSEMDLYFDFHIGGDDPSTADKDYELIKTIEQTVKDTTNTSTGPLPIRGMVLEENGRRHDVQRMLGHARRSNRLHCASDFIRVDTPANGLQVLGRNDNRWDQGQLFMLQNMSYLSPAGMAQVLLSRSYQPLSLLCISRPLLPLLTNISRPPVIYICCYCARLSL
jgi:hypothetical protein